MRRSKATVGPTIGDGSGTFYSARLSGMLESIRYVKPGAASYTDGVDVTITKESDGEAVLTCTDINASATFHPKAAAHDITGAAALRVAAGLPLLTGIALANERLKFVVAAGGSAKTGDFWITVS